MVADGSSLTRDIEVWTLAKLVILANAWNLLPNPPCRLLTPPLTGPGLSGSFRETMYLSFTKVDNMPVYQKS